MLSLKSQIGVVAGPYRDQVTQAKITAFCQAIGADESSVAPPTFLTVYRKGEFDLFQKLGIELSHVLHAEQEYQYEGSLRVGDEIEFETSVTQILEKLGSSGSMQFMTFETQFKSQKGDLARPIGKSKTTIVVREKKS